MDIVIVSFMLNYTMAIIFPVKPDIAPCVGKNKRAQRTKEEWIHINPAYESMLVEVEE